MIISSNRRSATFPRRARRMVRGCAVGAVSLSLCSLAAPAFGQARAIELTLENAVAMAMDDSYQVRRVRLDIERARRVLEAERAGLKSRVFMNFSRPELERVARERWSS